MYNLTCQLATMVLHWQPAQQASNPYIEVCNLPQRIVTLALQWSLKLVTLVNLHRAMCPTSW